MRKTILLLLIGIIVSTSCEKELINWDKDYYSYHYGVIINGERYHETPRRPFSQTGQAGMLFYTEGGFRFFRSGYYDKGISDLNGNSYDLSIGLGMDTASVFRGCRFEFSDRPSGYDINVIDDDRVMWWNGDLIDISTHSFIYEPYCICIFRDRSIPEEGGTEGYYVSINGWIEFGAFEESGGWGWNTEMIKFECIAVNCNGDTLRVENGYLGKYVDRF